MALTTTQLTEDLDRLISLREVIVKDKTNLNTLEEVVEDIVVEIQTLADGGDATAQAYLSVNRKFVINNELSSKILSLDGVPFTFTAGGIYCCDKGELEFFLKQAADKEFDFSESTIVAWLAATNIQFFYW